MLQGPDLSESRHGIQQSNRKHGKRVVPRFRVTVKRFLRGFDRVFHQLRYAGIFSCVMETVISRDVIYVRMKSMPYTAETDAEEILVRGRVANEE